MSDPATLPTTPSAHSAVRAWGVLRPGAPAVVAPEALKDTRKSGVFRLPGAGPDGASVIAKRSRRASALVERAVYEEALPHVAAATLRYHGFAEEDGERAWVFVEDAGGEEYDPDRGEQRTAASRWLAALHTARLPARLADRLPDQGAACYRAHLVGACERLGAHAEDPALGAGGRALVRELVAGCGAVADSWQEVERLGDEMPRTLVHGDFVPKNLRVRPEAGGLVVLVFDWEVAGWGPPAADLAECPDLAAYAEAVRPVWGGPDEADLLRWTECGRLFRLLAALSWASWDLAHESTRSRCLPTLRCYADDLAGLCRKLLAGKWEKSR